MKTPAQDAKSNPDSAAVVICGLDPAGRPRAAYFKNTQAALATKAAGLMQLELRKIERPEQAAVAAKLPAGRLYSNGRGLVPFIRQTLYSQLLEAWDSRLAGGAKAEPSRPATLAATREDVSTMGTQGDQSGTSVAEQPLPKGFAEVARGHVVLAQESPADGWWESVVVERAGETLTLKYRDYPKWPAFKRHLSTIGLINPSL